MSLATEPRVYVSMSSYLAGRMMQDARAANDYLLKILQLPSCDDDKHFPAMRALRLLRRLTQIELRLDTGATSIGKSLSRHFTAAYESGAEAWINFDDDVETSKETLAWLLAAIDFPLTTGEPRVCFAPYLLRAANFGKGEPVASVEWNPIMFTRPVHHENYPHGMARACKRAATGLVAMNRPAMEAIARKCGPIWIDDDGAKKYPVAQDIFEPDGSWHGPDFSLCMRIPEGVSVEALTTGETMHCGLALDLGELAAS